MPCSRTGEGDIGSFFLRAIRNGRMPQQNLSRGSRPPNHLARNGRLINVDAMLIAEAPKIAPHVPL